MRVFSLRDYSNKPMLEHLNVHVGSFHDSQTHVGQAHLLLWAPFVASAAVASIPAELVLGAKYGEDTRSYMKHIDASVDAFLEDVFRDICEYGSVITKDEAKSSTNPFGVLDSENPEYPGWVSSVCRDRGFPFPPLPGKKPHLKRTWNTAFSYWIQDWRAYMKENLVDIVGKRPDRAQLDTWYAQLEASGGWRDQFIKAGGKTITPVAPAPVIPPGVPWTGILIVSGIIAAVLLLRTLPIPRLSK